MGLVRTFLPALLLILLCQVRQAACPLMEGQEKSDFLASIDRELDNECSTSFPPTSTPNPRRLSASGAGIVLKRRSREEVGDVAQKLTPIRPPPSAVPDLGESYLTNPPPDPLNPTPGTPPVLAPGKLFPFLAFFDKNRR